MSSNSSRSNRSVQDIMSDIDDALSQSVAEESSTTFSVDFMEEDDDHDDDDDVSFEEELLQEEEEKTVSSNYTHDNTKSATRYDDDDDSFEESVVEETATPLTMLERGSHRTRNSRSVSNNQGMKSGANTGLSSSYTPLLTRSDNHDDEMSFQESIRSASTDGFSVSVASSSSQFSIHHMEKQTPRVNMGKKKNVVEKTGSKKVWPTWSSWGRKKQANGTTTSPNSILSDGSISRDDSANNFGETKERARPAAIVKSTQGSNDNGLSSVGVASKSVKNNNSNGAVLSNVQTDKTPRVTNRKGLSTGNKKLVDEPKASRKSNWPAWGGSSNQKTDDTISSTKLGSTPSSVAAAVMIGPGNNDAGSVSSKGSSKGRSLPTAVGIFDRLTKRDLFSAQSQPPPPPPSNNDDAAVPNQEESPINALDNNGGDTQSVFSSSIFSILTAPRKNTGNTFSRTTTLSSSQSQDGRRRPAMRSIDDISATFDDWSVSSPSKKKSSVETKRARQLIVDIESGSNTRSGGGGGGGNVMKGNSKRRICLCTTAIIAILALGITGILVGLNVITSPNNGGDVAGSNEIDPTTPTTPSEEEESGKTWYVDWNIYQCVQDCDNSSLPSCGGTRPSWEKPFVSLKECCEVNFESYIGDHWTLEECMNMQQGLGGNPGSGGTGNTAWPTMQPSSQVTDTDKIETPRPTKLPSLSIKSPTPARPPQVYQPSSKGGGSSEELYYANWDLSKCTKEDSKKMKPWDTGYGSKDECCQANFAWDDTNSDCSGDDTTAITAPGQSPQKQQALPSQASQEVSPSDKEASSLLYYANWDLSKCVEEDASTKKPWDMGYDSDDECCRVNFGWDEKSDCYFDEGDADNSVISSSTPAPSSAVGNNIVESSLAPSTTQLLSTPSPLVNNNMLYFANFNEGKCIHDGFAQVKRWGPGYESEDECCKRNFSWDENSYCYDSGNNAESGDMVSTTVPPSTATPSESPTLATVKVSTPGPSSVELSPPAPTAEAIVLYYANFDAGKCIPQNSNKLRQVWDFGYTTRDECCRANFIWDKDGDCYDDAFGSAMASTTPAPSVQVLDSPVDDLVISDTNAEMMLYYANYNIGKCIQEDSTQKMPWEMSYMTENDCCVANFSWNENSGCYAGNMMFYADYEVRKCVRKDSTQMTRWDTGYETEVKCCEGNFSWDKDGGCYAGVDDSMKIDDSVVVSTQAQSTITIPTPPPSIIEESTPAPSTKIISTSAPIIEASSSSQNPTHHPSVRNSALIPTYVPTRMPSNPPIISPTNNPISPTINPSKTPSYSPTWSPTASPEISSTTSPSDSPTLQPNVEPTPNPTTSKPTQTILAPSRGPSSSPTSRPTNHPTSSPTGRIEQLRVDLKALFPLSSDSLDAERSDQYRAMQWLVDNANYATYSSERKAQRWALATFYHAMYGKEWKVRTGWMRDTHECNWQGVACDDTGVVVISLDISDNNLWGEIPAEVSVLENIEHLRLSKNFISGFSSALFDSLNLRVLDLDKNIIEEIPSGINPSSHLEELYISNNKITSIPDELFQLQHVKNLWLSNNKIASPLPPGLGMMTTLEELDLESNYFTGSIPSEMFTLVNLHTLYLHDNILTGPFSPLFSQLTSLNILDLSTNYISGELPKEIGLIGQLSELHLGDNEIVGQLPWEQLSQLSGLTFLDISQNYLNSTIGPEIGSLINLVSLQLDNNYRFDEVANLVSYGIQGPIPGSIGNLNQLEELRLENNFVGGALPATLGNLQSLMTLRLESNNLQSSIPSALGNLSNLQYLHLWSNYLTSTISGRIGKLNQLRELFLDDNEITGTIPPELGQLTSATYISLADNHIDGVIPPTFGMLSSLERLDVQYNYLFGELPRQMTNLPLAKMKLEGNYFYGDIPDGVCQSVQYLSANCAATKRPTQSPTSKPTAFQGLSTVEVSQDVPTPSPTYEYWWSCNCCTTCYP